MTEAPVLVVGFKRLEAIRHVLSAVRTSFDGPIYVFLDHPRNGRPEEAQQCEAVREWVAEWADGSERISVRLSNQNLGCAEAVPAAFRWVFDQGHEALIFLEDDCLPAPDFFRFAQEMLARFELDQRVMMVSGNQFLPGHLMQRLPYSYYFTRYIHTWGWATWKRAWSLYDHTMSALSGGFAAEMLPACFGNEAEAAFYTRKWREQLANPHDTAWDYRWMLACLVNRGLCGCPARNLVRNIGFGQGSTHTASASAYQVVPRQMLGFPLRHPDHVLEWRAADDWWFSHMISKRPLPRLRRYLKRVNPATVVDEI